MGKVLNIFPDISDPALFTQQIVADMKTAEVAPKGIAIAIKEADGKWRMGYCNLTWQEKIEAVSNMQIDIIDGMILANSERYGLHTHED